MITVYKMIHNVAISVCVFSVTERWSSCGEVSLYLTNGLQCPEAAATQGKTRSQCNSLYGQFHISVFEICSFSSKCFCLAYIFKVKNRSVSVFPLPWNCPYLTPPPHPVCSVIDPSLSLPVVVLRQQWLMRTGSVCCWTCRRRSPLWRDVCRATWVKTSSSRSCSKR